MGVNLPINWPPPLISGAESGTFPPQSGGLSAQSGGFGHPAQQANSSDLNYYVLPKAHRDDKNLKTKTHIDHNNDTNSNSNSNAVDLKHGMTAAELIAYETEPNALSSEVQPPHHLPLPDGSHNTTLLTEKFLLHGHSQQMNETSLKQTQRQTQTQTRGSTDDRLADAINAESWRASSYDVYPSTTVLTSNSQGDPLVRTKSTHFSLYLTLSISISISVSL